MTEARREGSHLPNGSKKLLYEVYRWSAITSQALMRWRVALQFIALCLVMAALYLSVR